MKFKFNVLILLIKLKLNQLIQ